MPYTTEQKTYTVEYFRLAQHRFVQYPDCQRDFVWKLLMQQRLIDSMLRGYPIPPIVMVAQDTAMFGRQYLLVDGQQRFETIKRFVNDEFATAAAWRDPGVSPICPGKRYSELPEAVRNDFDQYGIRADVYSNIKPEEIELIFRNLQFAVPLTGSEKLWSYSGTSKRVLKPLMEHPVWTNTYKGEVLRKEVYQMLLQVAMFELYGGMANITTQRIKDLAAGKNISRQIPTALGEIIGKKLSTIQRVFKGVEWRAVSQAGVIYQCVYLLEQENCATSMIPEGHLATWFNRLRLNALAQRYETKIDAFYRLAHVKDQRTFWLEQLPILRQDPVLVFRDDRRRFSAEQKLRAWARQNGKCALCDKQVTSQADGHHILAHSLGGVTSDENCILIHESCHQNLERQRSQQRIELQ